MHRHPRFCRHSHRDKDGCGLGTVLSVGHFQFSTQIDEKTYLKRKTNVKVNKSLVKCDLVLITVYQRNILVFSALSNSWN